jgi:hypothetical protein
MKGMYVSTVDCGMGTTANNCIIAAPCAAIGADDKEIRAHLGITHNDMIEVCELQLKVESTGLSDIFKEKCIRLDYYGTSEYGIFETVKRIAPHLYKIIGDPQSIPTLIIKEDENTKLVINMLCLAENHCELIFMEHVVDDMRSKGIINGNRLCTNHNLKEYLGVPQLADTYEDVSQ